MQSTQPVRGVVFYITHFDLSSLISMARMQSAQRKERKVLDPGLNRGPSTCRADALPLSYRGLFFLCNPETYMYCVLQTSMNEV